MLIVICGPPCSGKSTHATTHAQPGHVIVDYDRIAQALGSPGHQHTPTQQAVTLAARRGALHAALRAHHDTTVWLVDSHPGPNRLTQFAAAGARYVILDAPRDELHSRATRLGRPAHAHRLIDTWTPPDVDPAHVLPAHDDW